MNAGGESFAVRVLAGPHAVSDRLGQSKMMRLLSRLSIKTLILAAILVAGGAALPSFAQDRDEALQRSPASDIPIAGIERAPAIPELSSGLSVALVFYDLRGTSGSSSKDSDIRRKMERALGISPGDTFDAVLAEAAIVRVRRVDGVRSSDLTIYPASNDRQIVIVISATLGERSAAQSKGVFAGNSNDFPVLWKGERGFLRLQVNGGLGAFIDNGPWFGNAQAFTGNSPIADDPPGPGTTGWFEANIETGIHGSAQLGNAPVYAYGALTWMTSMTAGNDLFRSDFRAVTRIEKAYAGVLYKPEKGPVSAQFSAGRQNWQLNEGFLFSQFSGAANAGPLPGLYLNPRTAFEETYIGKVKAGRFSGEWFYVDPEELDFVESRTAFRGVNLQYTTKKNYFGAFAYYDVPRSRTSFPNPTGDRIPRKGQRTANIRLGSRSFLKTPGLEVIGEYARQWNPGNNVGANAGYVSTGYTFLKRQWQPSLSYRFAHFGGDDPQTAKYERFDAPLSSGLDNWVQGVNFKKVVTNSNLNSHRIRFNVSPQKTLSFTFDYFYLFAPVKSASGRSFYGQEVNGAVRWLINKRLFLLGVTGVGVPGSITKERANNNTKNWFTFQTSLFWNL
jgi:hypothetical protein